MPIAKTDRTVVRNSAYQKNSVGIRERHNERKNEVYSNPDIITQRSHLNVHFKECGTTYVAAFDKMVEDGVISTRGLKADAKVIDEMVFDVNTDYFERHGGYDYAKAFFAEAYRLAVKEAGCEDYILSAVMHADERNRGLSEELGRDVYHYHLHVVYVPVVEKEIKWTKRCKDPALVGKTKEIIHQVSHSKKWASQKAVDEQGQEIRNESGKVQLIPSYSLLQDRFFEHTRNAGFTGFERGERGSTTQHLSVLDYKIEQDRTKLSALDERITAQKQDLTALEGEIECVRQVRSQVTDVDRIGKKKAFSSKVELTEQEYQDLTSLAKEGIASRRTVNTLRSQVNQAWSEYSRLKERFRLLLEETRTYREAMKHAPQKITEFLVGIIRDAKERQRTRQRGRGNRESRE